MHTLENPAISLQISDDSYKIVIADRTRRIRWQIRPQTYTYQAGDTKTDRPLPAGEVSRTDEQIVVRHGFGDKHLTYTWTLGEDFVELCLSGDAAVSQAALPGAFYPVDEVDWEIAVPTYQGCLIRRSGDKWSREARHGGHASFSMSMSALLTQRASLLIAHESPANWQAHYGEDEHGLFAYFRHHPCSVDGWKKATVRLYPCDPGLTAVCRRYRRVVQTRGDWRSWSEKMAEKPILKNLFGAVVLNDVEPNSVVVGNPARKLRLRKD